MRKSDEIKLEILNDLALSLEVINFICGDLIGRGCYRNVFEYNLDKKYVIKIENEEGEGDNWAEWRIWNALNKTEHAKWFAPCSWISDNGRIMLQKRTQEYYGDHRKWSGKEQQKIPVYFTDIKASNFGWIGKQLVCHDYSHCLEMFAGGYGLTKKMKKFAFYE